MKWRPRELKKHKSKQKRGTVVQNMCFSAKVLYCMPKRLFLRIVLESFGAQKALKKNEKSWTVGPNHVSKFKTV